MLDSQRMEHKFDNSIDVWSRLQSSSQLKVCFNGMLSTIFWGFKNCINCILNSCFLRFMVKFECFIDGVYTFAVRIGICSIFCS